MRFEPVRGTREARAAVRQRFDALMAPEAALAVIRRHLRPDAIRAQCSPAREPWNRFVVRVDIEAADGNQATYALKGYADEQGQQISEFCRALSRDYAERRESCPVVLPSGYIHEERLLVIPWVHGVSMAEAIRAGRTDIIGHAIDHIPRTLAGLHAARLVPEAPTPARAIAQFTVERWESHFWRFPEARERITTLNGLLQAGLPYLNPSSPALVHGDPQPGNFLLDDKRWMLLDLDKYGYADPALDIGYMLARLEDECLGQPAFDRWAPELVAVMFHACLESMPDLSPGNVAFFYAMTLIRKVLSRLFRVPAAARDAQWDSAVTHVDARATNALNAVLDRAHDF